MSDQADRYGEEQEGVFDGPYLMRVQNGMGMDMDGHVNISTWAHGEDACTSHVREVGPIQGVVVDTGQPRHDLTGYPWAPRLPRLL